MGSTSGEGAEADGAAAEGSEGEVRPKRSLPRRKSTAEGAALERPSSPKGGTRRRSSVRSIKPGCREGFLESKEVSQTADVSFALGDRVCYVGYADAAGPQFGVVRFVGETHFAGGTWVGIELESPCGKNDGQVKGVRYFECAAERGLFARPAHLRHADASDDRMRSQSLPGTAASVAADSGNDECASADVASAEDAAATAAAAAADPRAPGLEALPEDEVAVDDGRAAHSEPPLARIDDDKESGAEASQSRFKWTMSPLERRMLAIESLLELLEPAMRRLDALEGQVANLEEAARGSTRSATVSLEHLEKELKVATARTTGMEGRLAELENVFAALPERTGGDAAAGAGVTAAAAAAAPAAVALAAEQSGDPETSAPACQSSLQAETTCAAKLQALERELAQLRRDVRAKTDVKELTTGLEELCRRLAGTAGGSNFSAALPAAGEMAEDRPRVARAVAQAASAFAARGKSRPTLVFPRVRSSVLHNPSVGISLALQASGESAAAGGPATCPAVAEGKASMSPTASEASSTMSSTQGLTFLQCATMSAARARSRRGTSGAASSAEAKALDAVQSKASE
eukprot:TRINITY_DN30166_c0_g2_i1.p1 TRINITY_DN30166_c0_g2~~TRINITY_DN30166_c0_g2_i1.p1  ORF type:complete len:578 (+),score=156.91 TRINITY_DN30166_c0_g2_i1:151-1884(+)